uniref:Vicilin-like seed storage protein At2g18540 n=1 Tax=Drosophila rhopaloa TaxID=1041015 RepID=A0A6P4FKL9_DRORH
MAEARAKMLRDEVERMRTMRATYEDRRVVEKDFETAHREWKRMKQAADKVRLKRKEEKARKEAEEAEEAKRMAEEERRKADEERRRAEEQQAKQHRDAEWQQRLQKWEEEERQLWTSEVLVEAVPLILGGMQGIPPTGDTEEASHGSEATSQWFQSDGWEVLEEEAEDPTKEEAPRPGGREEQWQYCRTEIPQAHVAHAVNAFVAGGVQWRQHTVTWTWPVGDETKATEEAETPAQDTPKSNPRDPRVRREDDGWVPPTPETGDVLEKGP